MSLQMTRTAVKFASLVLHDHMRKLTAPDVSEQPRLTRRERDCLAFVAQGKSDWDISVILGVSHTTVISHVQNAKRKIGASSLRPGRRSMHYTGPHLGRLRVSCACWALCRHARFPLNKANYS